MVYFSWDSVSFVCSYLRWNKQKNSNKNLTNRMVYRVAAQLKTSLTTFLPTYGWTWHTEQLIIIYLALVISFGKQLSMLWCPSVCLSLQKNQPTYLPTHLPTNQFRKATATEVCRPISRSNCMKLRYLKIWIQDLELFYLH